MSAIVDFAYYSQTYMGQEADAASFPALCARAEDVVGAMTHWQVNADNIGELPEHIQTLYKKAVCAQVDGFAINGIDNAVGGMAQGWTVGKVHVSGAANAAQAAGGSLAASVSPMAIMYLEQTGLMNPAVPVVGGRWL
jgi:hypothetical protein